MAVASPRDRVAERLAPPQPDLPPVGRRQARPRWRDTRLLAGVLLVLVSVLVGARVVTAADATAPWLTVTSDLPAGHVLTPTDLAPARAHLDRAISVRYFRADSRAGLVGRSLVRPVGAGSLLPQDALAYGPTEPSRVVPVIVAAGRLPQLGPGNRVDLYVLVKGTGGDREVRVLSGAEFVGADTLGSGDTSVQLRVPVPDAVRVVAASQSERVDLVRIDDVSGGSAEPGNAGAAPTEAPGFGG
jgi:hypothetical protein